VADWQFGLTRVGDFSSTPFGLRALATIGTATSLALTVTPLLLSENT
jgi:hypothetical protein